MIRDGGERGAPLSVVATWPPAGSLALVVADVVEAEVHDVRRLEPKGAIADVARARRRVGPRPRGVRGDRRERERSVGRELLRSLAVPHRRLRQAGRRARPARNRGRRRGVLAAEERAT